MRLETVQPEGGGIVATNKALDPVSNFTSATTDGMTLDKLNGSVPQFSHM